MKNIIFSIFIDIPEEEVDNPGWYENGIQVKTDKSFNTVNALRENKKEIIAAHEAYAESIGAKYFLVEEDTYNQWADTFFKKDYPDLSTYDLINIFKHYYMRECANRYDGICYIDFDVIPNTSENIFEAHDIENKFCCANSNDKAAWGKEVSPDQYNTCIRNPATKYWNTHAMLLEQGHDPDNDVFNTGIMISSSKILKQLDYFKDFRKNMDLMKRLKTSEETMYPENIRRVFGYDNETLFSYIVKTRNIPIEFIDKSWHYIVDEKFDDPKRMDPSAKMYHFINKKMEWAL